MELTFDRQMLRYCDELDNPSFITAIYLVRGQHDRVKARLRAIALEESTGSWLDLPLESAELRARFGARVTWLYRVSKGEDGIGQYIAVVAFPVEDIGDNLPLLLSYVYGGISALPDVRLVDLRVPSTLAKRLGGGPSFGLEYLRGKTGRGRGPLLMGIVKPSIGLTPEQHARIAGEMAGGGVDIIKDDELLSDQPFSRAMERCSRVMEAFACTEGSPKTMYFANVTDRPGRVLSRAVELKAAGAGGILLNGYTTGLALIQEVASGAGLPVGLHPACAGAMYHAPDGGIDERVVFGRLPRIAGADIVIVFGPYGKFRLSEEALEDTCAELASPMEGLRASVPAFAAGVHPGQVPQLLRLYGEDVVLVAGASIVAHPDGPKAGATAMRQAIDAALEKLPLDDAAQAHQELRVALETWGYGGKGPRYDVLD